MDLSLNFSVIISLIGIFVCVVMMLRSLFFLLTAYKTIPKVNYYVLSLSLIFGIFHVLYNIEKIIKSDTYWFFILFLLGTSTAFYINSKIEKDSAYVLSSLALDIYSSIEKSVVQRFGETEAVAQIPFKDLSLMYFDKIFSSNGVFYIKRHTKYNGLFFETIMSPGAGMGWQMHPGCIEFCLVVEGEMIDKQTGKVYSQGEWATWTDKDPHIPCNNSNNKKVVLHVYFKEITAK